MKFENKESVNCWFSAGAASAVATKIALKESKLPVQVLNVFVKEEHPDNQRFLNDCEKWFGVPIIRLRDTKHNASIYEVYEREKFIASSAGAACTARLKRAIYNQHNSPDKIMVIGYTVEEKDRFEQLKEAFPEFLIWAPLIEHELSKEDCLAMVKRAKIELPVMYKMGYQNNNCIGCCKGGMGYWNKIRQDFPEVFDRMVAMQEKLILTKKYVGRPIKIGHRNLCYFWKAEEGWDGSLKDLPIGRGNYPTEKSISCSIMCEISESKLNTELPVITVYRKRPESK